MNEKTISYRPSYGVVLSIDKPTNEQTLHALVKLCFRITPEQTLEPCPPEEFFHDLTDEAQTPRLVAGSDFYPVKVATDVVVQGSAYNVTPKPFREVSLRIGEWEKKIAVFGRRTIEQVAGRINISEPEPFIEMPMTYDNAYGGVDMRLPFPYDDPSKEILIGYDHPGVYPRNPFGKGYLAASGDISPETEMPNLEDPDHLLSPDSLVTPDPKLWFRQPLPACFDWQHCMCFPRLVYAGADAWFPGPDNAEMPEVAKGYLMANYRAEMDERFIHENFFQEASCGLFFDEVLSGKIVTVTGMHPQREQLSFTIPDFPQLTYLLEGRDHPAIPRLHHLVIRPADELVCLVYGSEIKLHRTFIPGVHKKIPLAIRVNGDEPVQFEAPPTLKERLANARRQDQG